MRRWQSQVCDLHLGDVYVRGRPWLLGWALAVGTPARAAALICAGAEVPAPASNPPPLPLPFARLPPSRFSGLRSAEPQVGLPTHLPARADARAEVCARGLPVGPAAPCPPAAPTCAYRPWHTFWEGTCLCTSALTCHRHTHHSDLHPCCLPCAQAAMCFPMHLAHMLPCSKLSPTLQPTAPSPKPRPAKVL